MKTAEKLCPQRDSNPRSRLENTVRKRNPFVFFHNQTKLFYIADYDEKTNKRIYIPTGTSERTIAENILTKYTKSKRKVSELIDVVCEGKFLKETTKELYRTTLASFIRIVGDKSLRDVITEDIEMYLRERSKEVSRARLDINYRVLKAFFNYFVASGVISENPCKLKYRVNFVKYPKYFTTEEFDRFISAVDNERHYHLFIFAVSTGLRVSEILNLKWSDVDLENFYARITEEKTNTERIIPLSVTAVRSLKYFWATAKSREPSSRIFSYSRYHIGRLFRTYLKKSGINKHLTFHSLRHTFATWLIEEGADIYTVKELLGHKNIKTTEIYLHIPTLKMRKTVEKIEKLIKEAPEGPKDPSGG